MCVCVLYNFKAPAVVYINKFHYHFKNNDPKNNLVFDKAVSAKFSFYV